MRYSTHKLFAFGASLSLMSCNSPINKEQNTGVTRENKPNFVVIMADDISALDLSCYGNEDIHTPNLDRLAETGIQFHTCWSTPLCMPSRIQIMTGRYASGTRWYGNSFKPAGDPPYGIKGEPGYTINDELFFSEFFKSKGYATAISGKWHIEDYPEWDTFKKDYGFDEYCLWGLPDSLPPEYENYVKVKDASGPYWDVGGRGPFWQPAMIKNGKLGPTGEDDYGPDYFTEFINEFIRKHKEEPFFVYYPANIAHNWWYKPVSEETRWGTFGPVPELDSTGTKTGKRTPVGRKFAIEYLDHLIGKIVNNLNDLNIRDNTVIIFTADNGGPKMGKGRLESENGFRVPMIVNCPGLITEPVKSMDYVQLADVFPTVADMAGFELPDSVHFDGMSFKPVIEGKDSPRDYLYTYVNWLNGFKYKDYYLDGNDSLWHCVQLSEWKMKYVNVTDSAGSPELKEIMKKMTQLEKKYPAPDTTHNPMYERYKAKHDFFNKTISKITQ